MRLMARARCSAPRSSCDWIRRTWCRRRFWRPTEISRSFSARTRQSCWRGCGESWRETWLTAPGTRTRGCATIGASSRWNHCWSSRASSVQDALAATGTTASAVAARRERAVLLADALESLPADYREVVILRNLEGLKFSEVATRMDRSSGAVRMLWARAIERLSEALEGLA